MARRSCMSTWMVTNKNSPIRRIGIFSTGRSYCSSFVFSFFGDRMNVSPAFCKANEKASDKVAFVVTSRRLIPKWTMVCAICGRTRLMSLTCWLVSAVLRGAALVNGPDSLRARPQNGSRRYKIEIYLPLLEGGGVEVDALAGKFAGGRLPREVDHDQRADLTAARLSARPDAAVGTRHPRDLDDSLRPDDDVVEVEAHVRKRAEKGGVEGSRAGVAFPALAGRRNLVDAVLGQGVDETLEIARVFGFGV